MFWGNEILNALIEVVEITHIFARVTAQFSAVYITLSHIHKSSGRYAWQFYIYQSYKY